MIEWLKEGNGMFIKKSVLFCLLCTIFFSIIAVSFVPVSAAIYNSNSQVPQFNSVEVVDGGVRFKWDAVSNPNCSDGVFYRIYYKNSNGSWVRMAQTAATQYIDLDVHEGRGFYYTIRCVTTDGSQFASDYDDVGTFVTYYTKPDVSVKRKISGNSIYENLSWTGNASSYRIYRKTLGEDWCVIVNRTSLNGYMIPVTADDDIYAYKVCALDSKGAVASAGGVTPYYQDNAIYNNRIRWLVELMKSKGLQPPENGTPAQIFDYARENGTLKSQWTTADLTYGLSRKFASDTLCNTYQYKAHALCNYYQYANHNPLSFIKSSANAYYAADTDYKNLNTVAYYGWFSPDCKNKLYPKNVVDADEWDRMLSEFALYKKWHGKTVISFGDSGMQGRGNIVDKNRGSFTNSWRDCNRKDFDNKRFSRFDRELIEGPCEFFGEKYGMNHRDYAWSGATMGTEMVYDKYLRHYVFKSGYNYKDHVANQVRTAIAEEQDADLIILNGGDNDEYASTITYDMSSGSKVVYDWQYSGPNWFSGASSRDYHASHPDDLASVGYKDYKSSFNYGSEATLVGGTKTVFDLLTSNYEGVPIFYVRSHQIDVGNLSRQRLYQEKVMSVASSYSNVSCVDLFNISDLDGFNKLTVKRWCYDGASDMRGVHPNAIGYSKCYLPYIEDAIMALDE